MPNFIYAVTNRSRGNMSLHYGDTGQALLNRKRFLSAIGIDYKSLVCAKQVHSDNIKLVNEKDLGRGALSYDTAIADTDAFITNTKCLPLAIFTADCLSVFLYDPENLAIGLVHAGWRSSRKEILKKTINSMRDNFQSPVRNLIVSFGPAIRNCCYEVGPEMETEFPQYTVTRQGRNFLDLIKLNEAQALDAGIKKENISDSGICTFCHNKEFFSFRKEKDSCGRSMTVAMLT